MQNPAVDATKKMHSKVILFIFLTFQINSCQMKLIVKWYHSLMEIFKQFTNWLLEPSLVFYSIHNDFSMSVGLLFTASKICAGQGGKLISAKLGLSEK